MIAATIDAARGAFFLLLIFLSGAASAVDWSEPWREPQDSAAAIDRSDEYAWRLFVALNWPGNPIEQQAERGLSLGDDAPATWETWRTGSSVFLDDGSDPGSWSIAATGAVATVARFDKLSLLFLGLGDAPIKALAPPPNPIDAGKPLTETRMNRPNFEFIRAHSLYNVEGQLQQLEAQREIRFPAGAKEIKARWRPIDESEKSRYHTLTVAGSDGTPKLYGLVALHIATKDLPHGFWATFEHVDNPSLPKGAPWRLASHDTFACGDAVPDCNRAPAGIGLEGTVWENYRLRGTQTAFTDARGAPTLLANSQLETAGQSSSSCMTCHARAAIGRDGDKISHLSPFDTRAAEEHGEQLRSYYGAPDPAWFAVDAGGGMQQRLMQLDFEWSLLKARSKSAAQR